MSCCTLAYDAEAEEVAVGEVDAAVHEAGAVGGADDGVDARAEKVADAEGDASVAAEALGPAEHHVGVEIPERDEHAGDRSSDGHVRSEWGPRRGVSAARDGDAVRSGNVLPPFRRSAGP